MNAESDLDSNNLIMVVNASKPGSGWGWSIKFCSTHPLKGEGANSLEAQPILRLWLPPSFPLPLTTRIFLVKLTLTHARTLTPPLPLNDPDQNNIY